MKRPHPELSRRRFLLAAGAGGATATVALIAGQGAEAPKRAEAQADSKGYRVTEHVKKYYDTAKV